MNILITISSLQIGGEQRVVSILSDNFIKRGHDVTIYVLTNKRKKQFKFNEQVRIIYGDTQDYRFKNIRRIYKIRKLLKENNYDVVIGFAMIPSVLSSFAAFGICPIIVTERNDPAIYPVKMKIARFFAYHLCSGGIFQTNDAANYFPYIKNKTVIPNPINLNIIPDLYVGDRNKRIVNISRLVPEKNQVMLIKAFSAIHMKYPEYTLAFYGDGSEKNNILKLSWKYKIQDKVRVYPATNDIMNIIRKDAVFVLTSNHEGFPNSLAEALAMGIPCISTNCRIGGPKDMIRHNVNGKLFPVNDTEQLIKELDELLGNEKMQKEFSGNAIEIRNRLGEEEIIKLWLKEINKII